MVTETWSLRIQFKYPASKAVMDISVEQNA